MKTLTPEVQAEIMKQYEDLDLSWYQSTRGPQISTTLIGFSGMIVTMLKLAFNINIGSDVLNMIITAAMIVVFGIWTLVGYYKSRSHLMGQVAIARSVNQALGSELKKTGVSPSPAMNAELERIANLEPPV